MVISKVSSALLQFAAVETRLSLKRLTLWVSSEIILIPSCILKHFSKRGKKPSVQQPELYSLNIVWCELTWIHDEI